MAKKKNATKQNGAQRRPWTKDQLAELKKVLEGKDAGR